MLRAAAGRAIGTKLLAPAPRLDFAKHADARARRRSCDTARASAESDSDGARLAPRTAGGRCSSRGAADARGGAGFGAADAYNMHNDVWRTTPGIPRVTHAQDVDTRHHGLRPAQAVVPQKRLAYR
jgi:hypothetical protein